MKDASFNVRCSKNLKERLRAIASERECSITDVVVYFVTESVERYECINKLKNADINLNDYDD